MADDDELSDSSSDDDEDEKLDPNQDDDVCICGECKFGDPNIGGKCCGQNPCLRDWSYVFNFFFNITSRGIVYKLLVLSVYIID